MMLDHFQSYNQIDTGRHHFAWLDLDVKKTCKNRHFNTVIRYEIKSHGALGDAGFPTGLVSTM